MKRKVFLTMLCLAVFVCVSACGNKNNSTEISSIVEDSESIETEVVATETTELADAEDETFWDKVGIVDGIGTVYNGDTVELNDDMASYEFEKQTGFLQFAEINLSYKSAEVRLWVEEERVERIELSGEYELVDEGKFNDFGKRYSVLVDGNCILYFELDFESPSNEIKDGIVYSFWIYPKEGLVLNNYEFNNLEMQGVVSFFDNPNIIYYETYDSGETNIFYLYEKEVMEPHFNQVGTTSWLGVTYISSSVEFETIDGKNIERIVVPLSIPEEDIRADEVRTIYQLGETFTLNQICFSKNTDVVGDITLRIDEFSDEVVNGHVTISSPQMTYDEGIFYNVIDCSFLDENFKTTYMTIGYNSELSNEYYDYGEFEDGDDCDIFFRVEDKTDIMYLGFGYASQEGYKKVFVKLK